VSTWGHLVHVINRESAGRPWALNRSTDCRGLLQIMQRYHPGVDLLDPEINLGVGLRVWRMSGWRPWL